MEGEGECMCAGRGEKASVSYGLFYLCLLSLTVSALIARVRAGDAVTGQVGEMVLCLLVRGLLGGWELK